MNLCKYKNSLGKPNKGVHKYGAIADWTMTVILALIMAAITLAVYEKEREKGNRQDPELPYWALSLIWFFSLYLLAIFLHYIFCVKTRVNKILGLW